MDRKPAPPAKPAQTKKEARLAAALRENLRRRKAQSRARAAAATRTKDDPSPEGG